MKTLNIPAKAFNVEKGIMEDTSLPEWQRYYDDLARHEQFIENYRFFLDRIVRHLEWAQPEHFWTINEIKQVIGSEIEKSHSMDAPNKPGYYRANND